MHIIGIQDKLNEAKIKRASGSDCRGSHFDCEHFSDFSRHTPKQQHHLLRLCHLRSTSGKQRGRFCLPHCYPCFTPKRKDRQNFLLKVADATKIFELPHVVPCLLFAANNFMASPRNRKKFCLPTSWLRLQAIKKCEEETIMTNNHTLQPIYEIIRLKAERRT